MVIKVTIVNDGGKVLHAATYEWHYNEALETINITSTANYDSQYVTVTVNGEQWEQVSNLYEMKENSKHYIVNAGYDNTVNIMFGNGVYGQIPERGASIIIEFLKIL